MGANYDFSGWATKNDLLCSDGRTIKRDAFKDNDGAVVPLVWNHVHDDPGNVLGHALLENRPEGVYAYCTFNDTDAGKVGKELVRHGDVNSLSINANKLKHHGRDVVHGVIREVSLVLAGANPGAVIDFPVLSHGEDGDVENDSEAWISFGYQNVDLKLNHSDDENEETEVEEEKEVEEPKVEEPAKEELEHADEPEEEQMADNEKTVQDVFDELTEEQKNVVYFMIGQALEDAGVDTEEGEEEMKHNVFDSDYEPNDVLSHSDMETIFKDAKRLGSLKDAVNEFCDGGTLMHDDEEPPRYGIMGNGTTTFGIDALFPDVKNLNVPPAWIKRDTDWVGVVMNGVHKTPFSRIKSMFANITEDEARAKGYIKGHLKKEQVFSLLKRSTDPQTIYKKQKLDRDDVIDITDFDVVSWIKGEMRMMLDEEIARAILIGDGRLTSDDDHISHDHIRPIATDADLYTIKVQVTPGTGDADTAKNTIDAAVRARKEYKGSGNPIFFTTEDVLTEMLLLEDGISHKLYKSESELATQMRVSRIVTVPVMEGFKISGADCLGIIVNLSDYNVGADKGGAVNMFDDFDIDYNQMKYLIETRCSGALIKPYSAIVLTKGSN